MEQPWTLDMLKIIECCKAFQLADITAGKKERTHLNWDEGFVCRGLKSRIQRRLLHLWSTQASVLKVKQLNESVSLSHLSSSKVDARHCHDRLLCSSLSTDICFFILYFLPFWRSYTLRWGRTDFHTQLAESKKAPTPNHRSTAGLHQWHHLSLSLPSFFWFNTSSLTTESSNSHNKKRLKSLSWRHKAAHYDRPGGEHVELWAASLHLMKRPVFSPRCVCCLSSGVRWLLRNTMRIVCVCVCAFH